MLLVDGEGGFCIQSFNNRSCHRTRYRRLRLGPCLLLHFRRRSSATRCSFRPARNRTPSRLHNLNYHINPILFRRLLHARVFGRSNLVEGHSLGLELGQRLVGLHARLLALIVARLGRRLAHHLLLFR